MSNLKPVYLLAAAAPATPPLSILYSMLSLMKAAKLLRPSLISVPPVTTARLSFNDGRALKGDGAGKVKLAALASKKADVDKAKAILESSDIIYISGGDVEHGMQVLADKNLTDFIVGLYKQGKPFFGISAGSIMLAREWIRWTNPDDDATAEIFPAWALPGALRYTRRSGRLGRTAGSPETGKRWYHRLRHCLRHRD